MIKRIALVAGFCLAATAGLVASEKTVEQEKNVQLENVPAPVQAAVREHTQGWTIKAVIEESNEGKVSYEVETTRAGKTRDLVFDVAGSLLEAEEEIALDQAPAPVRSALLAHGRVVKLESVAKGRVVTYEAQVEMQGKRVEVLVDAAGKPVKH